MKRILSFLTNKKVLAITTVLLFAMTTVLSLAYFTDRVELKASITTTSFSADGYAITRTPPVGPFAAGEDVVAKILETNPRDDDIKTEITLTVTWDSPDPDSTIFGNANAADNATLTFSGEGFAEDVTFDSTKYTLVDNKTITCVIPCHVIPATATNYPFDLSLYIPESFHSTGNIEFTFGAITVSQSPVGFTDDFDPGTSLDYDVRVGWAASSLPANNGKTLMGFLTETAKAGEYGIVFEFPFSAKESPMKDFATRTGAKWSYYKDDVVSLTFIKGMTSIGDYAFPDFSKVTSVSFPDTIASIGTSAFDASGLTGEVTIPGTVTNIESLAFGNLPKVNVFTFGHTSNSLTLPDNTSEGRTSLGAFYVKDYVETTVNTSVVEIMYGYRWHIGFDNRRPLPTLAYQNYWQLTSYDEDNGIYEYDIDYELLENITFVDYYIPDGTEFSSWDASDPSVPGTVTAYLSADKKTITLAGNGYGLIFANSDSSDAFYELETLKTVSNADLFDTRNATTMEGMFAECRALTAIEGIETWNVSQVKSTSGMFADCGSIVSIDLSKGTCEAKDGTGSYTAWNPCALEDASAMFMMYGFHDSALTSVDTTGWDTSKLVDTGSMFSTCYRLEEIIGISEWDVGSLVYANMMFLGDDQIAELDVSKWNPKNLQDAGTMFGGCESVKVLDISGWDMSQITDSSYMLRAIGCETLTIPASLSVIGEGFAKDCPNLTTIIFKHPAGMDVKLPTPGSSDGAFYLYSNGEDYSSDAYVEYTPVKPLRTKIVTSNEDILAYNWAKDCRGYVVTVAAAENGSLKTEPTVTYNGTTKSVVIGGGIATLTPAPNSGYAYNGSTVSYVDENGVPQNITLSANVLSFTMPAADATIAPTFILGGPALFVESPTGTSSSKPSFTNRITYTVAGTVSDDVCGVSSVVVNGTSATINSDGTWSAVVPITKNGTSAITIVATNTEGRTTTETRYVRHGTLAVAYNANGGNFTSGTQNVVEYVPSIPKISKTSDVSDDGKSFTSSGYPANLETTDVIRFPGASALEVTITYATHNTNYDWVAVYDGTVTPTADNFAESISGKLGGTAKKTVTYTVTGDTVQFFFKSNNNYNYYYGYYAVVKEKEIVSGSYEDPTMPGYSFKGWYTDASCKEGTEFDLYDTYDDVSVYAKWVDDIQPELKVFAPTGSQSAPTYVTSSTFTVYGTVSDLGSGVQGVTVNGFDVQVNSDGTWSRTYELDEGYNLRVRVIATDNAGNTYTRNCYVYYDASAPELTLSIPDSATSVNPMNTYTETVAVSGTVVDQGCGLKSFTLNGEDIEVSSDGNWSVDLSLTGEITELEFVAVDNFDHTVTESRYVYYTPLSVTYNANGGSFTSGATNLVNYVKAPVVKTSKTANVSADGTTHNGGYGDNQEILDVVTIPGATQLEVTVTYATEGYGWDWVAIYDGSVTPTASNYNDSISNRLGDTPKTTKTYLISGDTVQFFFRSDVSTSSYFGYYATITGYVLSDTEEAYEAPTKSGYEFVGWYTDVNCSEGKEFDLSSISNDSEITVYAKYVAISPNSVMAAESNPDDGSAPPAATSHTGADNQST